MKKTITTLAMAVCLNVNAQIITTIAGNGTAGYTGDGGSAPAAELYNPASVAVDAAGNIYIADESNHCIRKVSTSGIIKTIAGNGTQGYTGDGAQATVAKLNFPTGVALDAAGNLYIADMNNQRIRKVNTSGVITTIAGNGIAGSGGDGGQATAAELYNPFGVAVDAAGNVYFSDNGNHRIRKISTAGIIKIIAGNGTGGYTGDGGAATAAELYYPRGIRVDAAGKVYIADYNNSRIRKVSAAGVITTIVGNGTSYPPGDGGQATAAGLIPYDIALDAAGNLYIADAANYLIRKVNTAGIISTYAGNGINGYSGDGGNATAAELNQPAGVAVDAVGNIYIADGSNNRIRKVIAPCSTTVTVSGTTAICQGSSTTLTASGATTYTWSANAGSVNTASVSVSPSGNTTYTVSGTMGCAASKTVTVNVFTASISGTLAICSGNSTTLTGSPATTYSWSTGDVTNTTTVTPTTTKSYTLTETNGVCTDTTVATVIVTPTPTISISGSQSINLGNSTTLTASPASTYSWSTGAVTNTITVNPTINTNYTLTETNGVCTASTVVTVSLTTAPDICMVTTDSATNYQYNIILWDKTLYSNVDSFIVYRYGSGSYLVIGTVSKDSSRFIDANRNIGGPNGGDPNVAGWQYTLAIKDIAGTISTKSPYHFTANFQQNNQNLSWSAYQIQSPQPNPLNGYEVLRDSMGVNDFHLFANTSYLTTSTQDPSYASYPNAQYRVDALGFNCTSTYRLAGNNSTDAAKIRSHSNTNNNRSQTTGLKQVTSSDAVSIYPNPNNGSFVIEPSNATKQTMQVYDVNGKMVLNQSINGKTTIDASTLSEGVYNISLLSNEGVVNKRLVIVK